MLWLSRIQIHLNNFVIYMEYFRILFCFLFILLTKSAKNVSQKIKNEFLTLNLHKIGNFLFHFVQKFGEEILKTFLRALGEVGV
jgi:hypothetical protein